MYTQPKNKWTSRSSEYDTCIETLETQHFHVSIQYVNAMLSPQSHLINISLKGNAEGDRKKNISVLRFTCHTNDHEEARRDALKRLREYLDTIQDELKQVLIGTLTGKDGNNAAQH